MQARIQKWGNSLAVRIPKAFASEVGLTAESPVEILLENGRLVIAPVIPPAETLDDLLAKIDDSNLHGEISTGPAVGNEVW